MCRAGGAKRSRNDYFPVIIKLTSPLGIIGNLPGKCLAFAALVCHYNLPEEHVCFELSEFQLEYQHQTRGWNGSLEECSVFCQVGCIEVFMGQLLN